MLLNAGKCQGKCEADSQDIGGADDKSGVVAVVLLTAARLHIVRVGVALVLLDGFPSAARAADFST